MDIKNLESKIRSDREYLSCRVYCDYDKGVMDTYEYILNLIEDIDNE